MQSERANKKKEKAERHRQRKINLAWATTAGSALSSPVVSVYYHLSSSIVSAGDADCASANSTSGASAGDALSSHLMVDGPLSTVLSYFLSLVTSDGLLFAISGCLFSNIAGGGPLSTISGCSLSLIANGSPLFAIFGRFLSPDAGSSFLSTVSDNSSLSLVPPAGSQELFLTSIPSCAHRFSLPFLSLFHFFFFSCLYRLPVTQLS